MTTKIRVSVTPRKIYPPFGGRRRTVYDAYITQGDVYTADTREEAMAQARAAYVWETETPSFNIGKVGLRPFGLPSGWLFTLPSGCSHSFCAPTFRAALARVCWEYRDHADLQDFIFEARAYWRTLPAC